MFGKLAIATSLAATSATFFANAESSCVEQFDEAKDYFPSKYIKPNIVSYGDLDINGDKFTPHNTTDLLEITYHGSYKIVTNKFQNVKYLLYQCGTEPPEGSITSGEYQMVLPVPHQGGLALTSTVQIPPLELLGLRKEIKAYIGNPQWVSSPCLIHMMEQGDLESVYPGGYNATEQAAATAEFVERNPDIVIIGGPYDDVTADRVMAVAASQERTNVATFDWIAFYAALYNKEELSNKIRAETQADYDCSSENARTISETQLEGGKKPTLLWANWIESYNNWSVAECPTWDARYYCEYASHCNIDILSRPEGVGYNSPSYGGRYWYLSDEEFLELGKDADYWVYGSQFWKNMTEKKLDLVSQFKSYQNQQVYDTQGMGPNAWHEQRLAEYDVVGLDLCSIVGHGNENHQRRWLRNLFNDPVGELPECKAPEELGQPYVPGGADCVSVQSSGASIVMLGGLAFIGLVTMALGL